MPFVTPPTVRKSWFGGGRYDIESTLQELVRACLADNIPNATLESNFLSVGFPDGAPEHCDWLTIVLVNGKVYYSFDDGVNWILVHDPATGVSTSFQTSTVIWFGGGLADIPGDWLVCDGQEVDRTTYADLFTRLGTAYGVGNGTTTFNLPNFRGRSPSGTNDSGMPNGADGGFTTRNEGDEFGAETHTLVTAELAQHNHVSDLTSTINIDTAGAVDNMTKPDAATVDNTGGDTAHNNMMNFVVGTYIIKT